MDTPNETLKRLIESVRPKVQVKLGFSGLGFKLATCAVCSQSSPAFLTEREDIGDDDLIGMIEHANDCAYVAAIYELGELEREG